LTADCAVYQVPTWFTISGQSRESLEHDKGTLRASGGRKAYGSWPDQLGWVPEMSFIPAADFSNSPLLTPASTLPLRLGVPTTNDNNKGTATLNPTTTESVTPRIVKRQLPRARKARARLRLQNKLRVAVTRTN